MRLLFNILRRQYLRALHLLNVESGDSLEERDVDSLLRFDLKSQYGRAVPRDDAWQMLRARISESEQQQAALVYQPAPPQNSSVFAWRIWVYVPRLAQAAIALLLFVLIRGVAPPLVEGPQSLTVSVLDTPTVVVAQSSDTLAPQINRAYEKERALMLATAERSNPATSATTDDSAAKTAAANDDAIERRMTHLPRDSKVGSARLTIVSGASQPATKPHNGVLNAE